MDWNDLGKLKLYRFMEPRWADDLVNHGSLRIGTLDEYRAQEDAQGDPLDAMTIHHSGYLHFDDATKPEWRETLDSFGIEASHALTIDGAESHTVFTGHALCLTKDRGSQAFPGKAAVVEFAYPDMMAAVLNGAAPAHMARRCRFDFVQYLDTMEHYGVGRPPIISPFSKRKIFEAEQEFRFFWRGTSSEPAFIRTPLLRWFVKRVA